MIRFYDKISLRLGVYIKCLKETGIKTKTVSISFDGGLIFVQVFNVTGICFCYIGTWY